MKLFFSVVIVFWWTLAVFAQTNEAKLIYQFGFVPCGHLMAIADNAHYEWTKSPSAKIYLIYYEGKHYTQNIWNKKLQESQLKSFQPIKGDAVNRAKELGIYLRTRDFNINNIVLLDGGYREEFIIEIWIVPDTATPPTPKPTIAEKDVTFRKGNPRKPRDCSKAYDG
jgi:hypothetical protein